MDERNQEAAADEPHPEPPPAWAAPIEPAGAARGGPAAPVDPFAGALPAPRSGPDIRTGLTVWLVMLGVLGIGGLLAGQPELAAFVALAGLYIAAQAADLEPRWTLLYQLVTWVVPVGFALVFISLGQIAAASELAPALRTGLTVYAVLAAAACLALIFRPVAEPITVRLFREDPSTHALRLTTRLAVAGVLLAAPGAIVIRDQVLEMLLSDESLLDSASLAGQMVGMAVLALAAVGFLIRRGPRDTLDRLGLGALGPANLLIVGLGAATLFALNAVADVVQHRLFPGLWADDQAVTQLLSLHLEWPQALLLGLAAGVGEEVTLRGALQPRLGIVLTAALFAALHVQYSWFGMLVIFLLGSLLGVLRARTNTTVAIAVHAVYDVLAVLSS